MLRHAPPFGETALTALRFQTVQPFDMIRRLRRPRAGRSSDQRGFSAWLKSTTRITSNPTSGVAERYAQALFSLAQEQNATDAVADALRNFRRHDRAERRSAAFRHSPVFSAEEQLKASRRMLSQLGFGGITANFIKLVATKRRLFVLPDMIRDFNALDDKAKGVTRRRSLSPSPSPDHFAALEEALRQVSGGQTVKVNVNVDPSIIGGLVVKLGSRMVDASLKTKLNSLRTRMKGVG